ncbi:MAG: response regulator [Myxococcota bacterium]|nr:response regulator [Myxococcota bacterium]
MTDAAYEDVLNVLVVDDDPALRGLICTIITNEGHQPFPADSAEAGLGLLPMYTFQVAFLDQNLPGMTGLVLGQYLRQNNPKMLIALVTAESDKRLIRRSRQHHVVFIPKPFDVEDITRALRAFEATRSQERAIQSQRSAENFAPRLDEFLEDIDAHFDFPSIPNRIEDRLIHVIGHSLNQLRSPARYNESDRIFAYVGLVTALTLAVRLPKTSAGLTYFEEYDRLMAMHGRRVEFSDDVEGTMDSLIL